MLLVYMARYIERLGLGCEAAFSRAFTESKLLAFAFEFTQYSDRVVLLANVYCCNGGVAQMQISVLVCDRKTHCIRA